MAAGPGRGVRLTTGPGLVAPSSKLGTAITCSRSLPPDVDKRPERPDGAGERARGVGTGDVVGEPDRLPLLEDRQVTASTAGSDGREMAVVPLLLVAFDVDELAEVEVEVEGRLDTAFERVKLVWLSTGLEDSKGCWGSGLVSEGTGGVLSAS